MLTPAQAAQLKTAMLADNTYGLATAAPLRNDTATADICNFIRDGVTACPDNGIVGPAITVHNPTVSVASIVENMDFTDMVTTSTALQDTWYGGILNMRSVDMLQSDGQTANPVLKNLKKLLTDSSPSQNAIIALAKRNGSFVENNIPGIPIGTIVTINDIALAMN